ncbi:AsmA-like C-terminal region-containing protein [Microbaculum marinum]|uniref:AsmA-like C-terminal region-containing protein n=1 Tax=Microbaculum marinum TaxID=1764581 RepID=A0AAW9RW57_9HYPH
MAASETMTRKRPVWARLLAGLLGVLVVVVVAAAALVVLFPKAGIFSPMRAALMERVLSSAFGQTVVIDGPVTFELGRVFRATGSDIRVLRSDDAGDQADGQEVDRLDHGSVGLLTSALLAGRVDLEELTLDGVHLAENSTLFRVDVEGGVHMPVEARMIGVVPWIVYLSREADVQVTDVHYVYSNQTSGWLFDVVLDELSNTRNPANDAATLTSSGTINGKTITIDNDFVPADGEGPDRFAMTVTTPGAVVRLTGFAPETPEPTVKSMAMRTEVSSVGDVLELFELQRTFEGTGTLSADVAGDSGLPALENIVAEVRVDSGLDVRVTGRVDDLANRKGFDITAAANWPPGGAEISEDEGLLSFAIYQITARLAGDLGALAMTDGWITTNLFSSAIPQFGPISAADVRREDNGRIAVVGLNVLAGPPEDRTLDLSGQIGDLLRFAEFELKGNVSVPVAALLDLQTDAESLGRLAGEFAVSDAGGEAGIDTFNASITGSQLVSADVALKADQSQSVHNAAFNVNLNVPDYAQLASALSVREVPIGAIAFKGALAVASDSGSFNGQLSFGSTVLTEDLVLKTEGARPVITGTVSSPDLIMADLSRLVEVGTDLGRLRAQAVAARADRDGRTAEVTGTGKALLNPRIDVEVNAGRVDSGGDSASGVSGRFGFDDGLATAQGVKLKYRSGLFDFDGRMHVREAGRPFEVDGRMSNWPIGEVLKDLDVDLPLSGSLAASFKIASSGDTVHEAVRAANGDLNLHIRRGSIGNRMLDFSGLVLPSWLTAESAKTGVSRIECFDARLAFSPGVAVVNSAVVETDDVIVTASGRIDFKADTIDIQATPRALHPNLIPIVSPFSIEGKLSDPKVEVKGGMVGRAAAEALALPFNALGTLLGVDKADPKSEQKEVSC